MIYVCKKDFTAFKCTTKSNIGNTCTILKNSKWIKTGIDHDYYIRFIPVNHKNKTIYFETTKPIFEQHFKPITKEGGYHARNYKPRNKRC